MLFSHNLFSLLLKLLLFNSALFLSLPRLLFLFSLLKRLFLLGNSFFFGLLSKASLDGLLFLLLLLPLELFPLPLLDFFLSEALFTSLFLIASCSYLRCSRSFCSSIFCWFLSRISCILVSYWTVCSISFCCLSLIFSSCFISFSMRVDFSGPPMVLDCINELPFF